MAGGGGAAAAAADITVAIIGAGAAGLAAARRLIAAGLAPIVLEGRQRIGGRAHTVIRDGVPLDLGCGWLHSGDRNEWAGLATALGLSVDARPAPWRRQTRNLHFPPEEQAAFQRAEDAFYARIEAAAQRGEEGPASAWLEPGDRWTPLMEAISSYYNGVEFAGVSIRDFDAYVDTGSNWRVREGFGTAVAAFGAAVPVRLGWPVSRLDHAGPRLRLTGPDGTLEASHAIVTVPPTVLLAGGLRFSPELPDKLGAAEGVPLGLANKAFLAVSDPDALPADGHVFGRTDRVGTGSYHIRAFGRPMIEGFFGGACAAALEDEGPAGFAAFAIEELAALFGSAIRRILSPAATTAWRADPLARGAYSHALPGRAADRLRWAAPVGDRLFFAGEACSVHDFSTAHGAYRTGLAAAEAVLAAARA